MARPLSQEARRKAVEAAQAVLGEQGIDGCTLEAVAKRSGVAKTTLYRHWGSANVLLVHAIDCSIERVPTPNTGSIRTDLHELLSHFMAVANDPAHCRLLLDVASASAKDPELAAVKQAMLSERARPLHEIVQRAIDRGEIPSIDLERAAEFIEGPMVVRVIKSQGTFDSADLPATVELIARGLGAGSTAPAAQTTAAET